MDDDGLLARARDVMRRSYSPYSGYRVGAAILLRDGSVVQACNVENVSYGLTVCAERAAVAQAVAEGRTDFVTIAIVTDGSESIVPCGACRQVLAEFAPDIRVVSEGIAGRGEWPLRALLPEPFEAPPEWRNRKDEEGI